MSAYAELAVTSNFSFLRAGSHPEEYVDRAKALGLYGLGIADRNSVAGVVRAHSKAKEKEVRFLPGARLVFADGTPDILAYPHCLSGWSNLTRLLSRGKRRAEKGACTLFLADLLDQARGLQLIVMPVKDREIIKIIRQLREACDAPVRLAASMLYRGDDARRLERLAAIASETGARLIAVNDVLYHHEDRRPLQDVVTCIREHLTLDKAGKRLAANAERHLKPADAMMRLFRRHPEAVRETPAFVKTCGFSLDELKPTYPLETRQGYATPQAALIAFAEEGAQLRYPEGVPKKVRDALDYEIALIAKLEYAPYFLTVHDIVHHARENLGILCQGRGSSANSTLCFCLGITEVDPMGKHNDLLFERFLSVERGEPPDIDVDFEHERREEVIQYVYEKYGRERAAMTGTTICYRGRSAIREVGKVFGLSDDAISALAGTLWGWSASGVKKEHVKDAGLDPEEPQLKRVLALAHELIEFPRHLSQHVGGFVMTEERLDDIVPIENAAMEGRTVIEWNKDDIETLGILKVDLLGLGMLSCLRRSFDFLRTHYGLSCKAASDVPPEEKPVYDMLCRADSVGVFQVESRAQMSMLPRLKPKTFYDLVIEVAIVRPGPIQGDMVHPYLRRREGKEPVIYPSPAPEHGPEGELRKILEKTLGVPLFQEQAMRVAIDAAKFEPAQADKLRRAMATFRRVGTIQTFRDKFVATMSARGYDAEFAANCFRQIEGFGEYGFPESHAASFALLVYASAWIKCHYPDVFAAALLNSQPMGFYAAAQLVRDAEEHSVEARPVDINFSLWDSTLEPAVLARLHSRHASMAGDIHTTHALRLGLRQISGFSEKDAALIAAARIKGKFHSLRDLWLRTGLSPGALRRLAQADAFGSLGHDRRAALWELRALRRVPEKDDLPLLARVTMPVGEPDARLPRMAAGEQVIADYRHLNLSLKAHPLSFLRDMFAKAHVLRSEELALLPSGLSVTVAGLVLVRQHPGSAKSIFMTLEDETGIANVIVWPKTFEKFRAVVMGARLVTVRGTLQNESGVVHVIAERLDDCTTLLRRLTDIPTPSPMPVSPLPVVSDIGAVMPKGRNFH